MSRWDLPAIEEMLRFFSSATRARQPCIVVVEPFVVVSKIPMMGPCCEQVVEKRSVDSEFWWATSCGVELEVSILFRCRHFPPGFKRVLRSPPSDLTQICQRRESVYRFGLRGTGLRQGVGLFVAWDIGVSRDPADLGGTAFCS